MKRLFQVLTIIPIVFMLFVIFGFSAQNVEESSSTSERIVIAVAEVIVKDFDELPKEQSQSIIESLTHYIRKLAHFSEFALLGLFTSLHIVSLSLTFSEIPFNKVLPFSWLFCTFVAVSDELHQLFVPGRGCGIGDMVIDSMGSLTGALIILLVVFVFFNKSLKSIIF